MKKITDILSPKEWESIVTKYSPSSKQVSLANFTTGTKNIETDVNGNITKRPGGTVYDTLPSSARDLYEIIFTDGVRHLLSVDSGNLRYSSGDGVSHFVNGGYSVTANFEFVTASNKAYFDNGVDSPQVYDKTVSYGGVTYSVPRTKIMGAQAPLTAPTVTLAAGGSVPDGAHTYKITFLYYDFEESNDGPSSAVVTAGGGNNTVNLTNIPVGGYGVTARKVYRDNNDGNYTLLTTITDNTTTTYSDTLLIGPVPTPIPTDHNVPPTFGLIVRNLERNWIAKIPGNPFDIFFSDAGFPDIFPTDFFVTCNEQDPITSLFVFAGRVIVFNHRSMGQILGTTSDSFRYDIIDSKIGCVDNRSIQERVVDGVPLLIWLSQEGFYSYDGNSVVYIGDLIQTTVDNLQQASQQKGSNNQSTEADFLAGTPSNGISLTIDPGLIIVRAYEDGSESPGDEPRRVWNDNGDWQGGSSLINAVTHDASQTLRVPIKNTPLIFDFAVQFGTWTHHFDNTSFDCTNGHPGEILSPNFDNESDTITSFTLMLTTHFAGNSPGDNTVTLETSDDLSVWTPQSTQSLSTNPGGSDVTDTFSFSMANHRFYRFRIHTSSGLLEVFNPVVTFTTTTTWISEAIDTTSDVVSYDALTVVDTIPGGTSITITVATSANNILYTSFVPFGSAVLQRYIKVKAVLTATGDDLTTPLITSIELDWTITANFVSSIIDTNVTPSGWDIFVAQFATNGGTIQFQMRSAATSGAIPGATFYNVTPGMFPPGTVLPLRFTQWKVIITASAHQTPDVDGVTISWFIGNANAPRMASIFVNHRYYATASEIGQTVNNIVFELDLKGKWRFHRDMTIGAFSFFFDAPYYASDSTGDVVKWLTGFTDQGVNIAIDVRWKAMDFATQQYDNSEYLKSLDYVILQGIGTGASYSLYFSTDEGTTFTLLKYEDGNTFYTSINDGKNFYVRFKCVKDDSALISGKTIMLRLTTNDAFNINVESVKAMAWMWEFEPFLLG